MDQKTIKAKEYRLFRQAVGDLMLKIGFEERGAIFRKVMDRVGFLPANDLRLLQSIRRKLEGILR